MSKPIAIIGRILLALIFIVAGIRMLMMPASAQHALLAVGLPVDFATVAGIAQLVLGIALALGFAVRGVSVLLILFCCATTLFFHHRMNDPAQFSAMLRDAALIGGLMLAFAQSHMWDRYYALRSERREILASHEAELRAAHAETHDEREARIAAEREAQARDRAFARESPAPTVTYQTTPSQRRRWWDW